MASDYLQMSVVFCRQRNPKSVAEKVNYRGKSFSFDFLNSESEGGRGAMWRMGTYLFSGSAHLDSIDSDYFVEFLSDLRPIAVAMQSCRPTLPSGASSAPLRPSCRCPRSRLRTSPSPPPRTPRARSPSSRSPPGPFSPSLQLRFGFD